MQFLLTAAATLAFGPATVYSYALAGASVRYYDYCKQDSVPDGNANDATPIVLQETKCQQVEFPAQSFEFYAVNGIPMNDNARWHCDGIQVYTNNYCSGEPDSEILFTNPDDTTFGTCQPKRYGPISLRLKCNPH
jgi:hypothetical protein